MLDILLRSEKVSDIKNIDALIKASFVSDEQAGLVIALRDKGALLFSIVAVNKETDQLLGHMALSLVTIAGAERTWQALCLMPLSVTPEFQKQGVGSALINYWFEEYADSFFNAVVLFGQVEYFQTFGFQNAVSLEFDSGFLDGFEGANGVLQIKDIKNNFSKNASGIITFDEAFLNVK